MDGRGTLTIRTCAVGEDAIKVIIADDGPGIPADNVDRIFQPFFTTKPFGEGTGVGLDLAWRIINQKHHGNIRVESSPGDTRFIIVLPVVAPKPEEAPADVAE
jgi:signal transduction histidine kinase